MPTKKSNPNKQQHPLLHHPIKLDHAMHLVTGVTSMYIFALLFALVGFIGGYSVAQGDFTKNEDMVETKELMQEEVPVEESMDLTEEDIDVFLQELLLDEQAPMPNEDVMPVDNNQELPVVPQEQSMPNDDTSLIDENNVMISLTENDSLAMNESYISESPNSSSTSATDDMNFYTMIISLGGTVYALNLLHEDEEE